MPEPLGKAVVTTTTMKANLNPCLAICKSLTGCLHFVHKTPVDWYSKKQATVGTAVRELDLAMCVSPSSNGSKMRSLWTNQMKS